MPLRMTSPSAADGSGLGAQPGRGCCAGTDLGPGHRPLFLCLLAVLIACLLALSWVPSFAPSPPATSFCLLCAKGSLPSLLGLDLPRGAGSTGGGVQITEQAPSSLRPRQGPCSPVRLPGPRGDHGHLCPCQARRRVPRRQRTYWSTSLARGAGASLWDMGVSWPWRQVSAQLCSFGASRSILPAFPASRSCPLRGLWLLASSSRPALVTSPLPAFLSCEPGG